MRHVLTSLGLTTGMAATDAAIQRNILGHNLDIAISIEEMEDIMKIFKSLGESVLLIRGVSETI